MAQFVSWLVLNVYLFCTFYDVLVFYDSMTRESRPDFFVSIKHQCPTPIAQWLEHQGM